MNAPDAVNRSNPFPGLRPFREGEEHLYFGREAQIDDMVDALARARFLAVVGASGSGKSSLINCGLVPALHRGLMTAAGSRWRVVVFRPGGRPIRALAEALAHRGIAASPPADGPFSPADLVETTLRMSRLGLLDAFEHARLPEDTNLLVVADQFEELFRYRHIDGCEGTQAGAVNEEATAFVNLLLEPRKREGARLYVALTMRSDFLGECAQYYGLPEAINYSQYLVPRLTRDERRIAIEGPIQVAGARITPVLLTQLVNDVGDNPDQLSILQHALNRTWAYWEHQGHMVGSIDLPHYDAIGGMAHALDRHAERAYAELPDDRSRELCERIFRALTDRTDMRGIRRPTPLDLLSEICQAPMDDVKRVLDVFRKPSRSFLMPPLDESLVAQSVIDISHESLMRVWQRLARWALDEARLARDFRRVADIAQIYYDERKAALLRDPDLQVALDWMTKHRPNMPWASRYGFDFERTVRFLGESEQARSRERADQAASEAATRSARQRARRRRAAIGLGLVAALAAFGIVVTVLYLRAEAATRQAQKSADGLQTALQRLAEAEERASTAVPDVRNLSLRDAYEALKLSHLTLTLKNMPPPRANDSRYVVAQEPAPGLKVETGRTVAVDIRERGADQDNTLASAATSAPDARTRTINDLIDRAMGPRDATEKPDAHSDGRSATARIATPNDSLNPPTVDHNHPAAQSGAPPAMPTIGAGARHEKLAQSDAPLTRSFGSTAGATGPTAGYRGLRDPTTKDAGILARTESRSSPPSRPADAASAAASGPTTPAQVTSSTAGPAPICSALSAAWRPVGDFQVDTLTNKAKGRYPIAIEGQVNADGLSFRATYGPTDRATDWNIYMTKEKFDEQTERLKNAGYRIVCSQSLRTAAGDERVQAVWIKGP